MDLFSHFSVLSYSFFRNIFYYSNHFLVKVVWNLIIVIMWIITLFKFESINTLTMKWKQIKNIIFEIENFLGSFLSRSGFFL